EFPTTLLTPNFDSQNVFDAHELAAIIRQTAEAAGLADKRQWSLALPEGAARSFVVLLESKPASRKELEEILNWKIERVAGVPATDLITSRQKLHQAGKEERYLVTAARTEVITEYENVFTAVGWHAGLMLPRHLGEVQWLVMDKAAGDKMLVSSNSAGFT